MLSITGRSIRACAGVSRREFMRIGALGAAGLSLPELLRARAASSTSAARAPDRSFGKAKACILLFMYGGPSQLETFDMKAEAPAEVRGDFRPITTNVSGVEVCEHLPRLSRCADKYAIVRSVTQNTTIHTHGFYAMLTGNSYGRQISGAEAEIRPDDHPHIGSILARLRPPAGPMPPFVALPWVVKSGAGKSGPWAGQSGGFLGRAFDPLQIVKDPSDPDFRMDSMLLSGDVSWDRLNRRRDLLDTIDHQAQAGWQAATAGRDISYAKAFGLIGSPKVRQAFDLTAEAPQLREQYGQHTFGQGALLARRLVEHGVPLVTVYWQMQQNSNPGWDTHSRNCAQMKARLLPFLDPAFATLLNDLSDRGLLDETLVVWAGEFGRTPRLNATGGRDHWGPCMSAVLAGGGIRGGQVHGRSDKIAAYPADSPVRPGDIHATIYHALGISPHAAVTDLLGRPRRVCDGEPLWQLLG